MMTITEKFLCYYCSHTKRMLLILALNILNKSIHFYENMGILNTRRAMPFCQDYIRLFKRIWVVIYDLILETLIHSVNINE